MLRYLVAGTGMMGNIVTPIIRQSGGEIAGVMELTKELAQNFINKNQLSSAKAFASTEFASILANENIDVVAILVPNNMHAALAIEAANAGKNILIEKPLALTYAESKDVLSAIQKNNVAAEIDSMYRHHQLLSGFLTDIVNSNELGKPIFADMSYIQDWQMHPDQDIGWRPFVKFAGKGKLVGDLGSHVLQTLLHIFGGDFESFEGKTYNVYPKRYKLKSKSNSTFTNGTPSSSERPDLYEELDMRAPDMSGDDIATATFTLRTEKNTKLPGTFYISQVHAGFKNDFSVNIAFEKGHFAWRAENPNVAMVSYQNGVKQFVERTSAPSRSGRPAGHPQGYGDAVLMELEKFHNVIESKDKEKILAYSTRNIGNAVKATKIVEEWANTECFSY